MAHGAERIGLNVDAPITLSFALNDGKEVEPWALVQADENAVPELPSWKSQMVALVTFFTYLKKVLCDIKQS
jgi:hypothetical protein